MSIPQKKQEHYKRIKPMDVDYARTIDHLRLELKHFNKDSKPGSIGTLKTHCLRRFEAFNKVTHSNTYNSLYELCPISQQRHTEKRAYIPGGTRDSFKDKDGHVCMIVFHIRKSVFSTKVFYVIAKKLRLEVHILSSFLDPHRYISVVFSRREEDDKGKAAMSTKSVSIFKRLFKVIGSFSFVDII